MPDAQKPVRDPDVHTPFFADKSFWLVVLGVLIPILNRRLNLDLSVTELAEIATLIVGFVVSSKWKQTRVIEAKVEAASAAQAAGAQAGATAVSVVAAPGGSLAGGLTGLGPQP